MSRPLEAWRARPSGGAITVTSRAGDVVLTYAQVVEIAVGPDGVEARTRDGRYLALASAAEVAR